MIEKTGVALVLHTPGQKILILRETKAKPELFRTEGMLTVPCETVEAGESNNDAILRLMDEELGIRINQPVTWFGHQPFHFIHPIPVFPASIQVNKEFDVTPKDPDVEYHGWVHINNIREAQPNTYRIETLPFLQFF